MCVRERARETEGNADKLDRGSERERERERKAENEIDSE